MYVLDWLDLHVRITGSTDYNAPFAPLTSQQLAELRDVCERSIEGEEDNDVVEPCIDMAICTAIAASADWLTMRLMDIGCCLGVKIHLSHCCNAADRGMRQVVKYCVERGWFKSSQVVIAVNTKKGFLTVHELIEDDRVLMAEDLVMYAYCMANKLEPAKTLYDVVYGDCKINKAALLSKLDTRYAKPKTIEWVNSLP